MHPRTRRLLFKYNDNSVWNKNCGWSMTKNGIHSWITVHWCWVAVLASRQHFFLGDQHDTIGRDLWTSKSGLHSYWKRSVCHFCPIFSTWWHRIGLTSSTIFSHVPNHHMFSTVCQIPVPQFSFACHFQEIHFQPLPLFACFWWVDCMLRCACDELTCDMLTMRWDT